MNLSNFCEPLSQLWLYHSLSCNLILHNCEYLTFATFTIETFNHIDTFVTSLKELFGPKILMINPVEW